MEEDFKEYSAKRTELPFLIMGAAIVAIILLLVFLTPGKNDDSAKSRMASLEDRMSRVEERSLEMDTVLQRLSALERQTKELETLVVRLDRDQTSLAMKLDQIGRNGKKQASAAPAPRPELTPRPEPTPAAAAKKAPVKTAAKTAAPAKTPAPKKAVYHRVRKGDTLFGIAKKYGVSVTQIRELNRLSKKGTIYPGQKLVISR